MMQNPNSFKMAKKKGKKKDFPFCLRIKHKIKKALFSLNLLFRSYLKGLFRKHYPCNSYLPSLL